MPLDPNQIAFAKDLLRSMRNHYEPTDDADGYNPGGSASNTARRHMALEIIELIESRAPESELWTSSPDAAEVTAESRLGDHLYITRKHFGLPC